MDFADAWRAAQSLPRRLLAAEMDAELHRERVDRTRHQRTVFRQVTRLPDGVMIRQAGRVGLLAGGKLLPWSFGGYDSQAASVPTGLTEVLTPPSIVAAIEAGYRPMVHPSAMAAGCAAPAALRTQPPRS